MTPGDGISAPSMVTPPTIFSQPSTCASSSSWVIPFWNENAALIWSLRSFIVAERFFHVPVFDSDKKIVDGLFDLMDIGDSLEMG